MSDRITGQVGFWLALLLVMVSSVDYRRLPASDAGNWQRLVIATIVLGALGPPALLLVPQKMEAAGVILRRVALVSPERAGMSLTVFAAIEAVDHSPAWLQAFSDFIAPIPTVMEVWRMAGEVDYKLRLAAADMAEYDRFYKRLIAAISLKKVTSRLAMERIKATTAYPLHGDVFYDRTATV